jgi:hypothetical protein
MNIWIRFGLGLALAAVMSILVFLPSPAAPDPVESSASLVFDVDPIAQTVTISQELNAPLSQWGAPASVAYAHDAGPLVHRRLGNGELEETSYTYFFSFPNQVTILASFTNLSEGVGYVPGLFYHLPFEFKTAPGTSRIDGANTDGAGLSMAGLLGVGGVTPGVLDPQETTATQTFLVDHQGVPFSYFVDAFADVH